MRIFNQKTCGDWDEVLARVLAELERDESRFASVHHQR
jgi:hypothetical protein